MLSTMLSNQAISQTVPVSDPNSFDDDVNEFKAYKFYTKARRFF